MSTDLTKSAMPSSHDVDVFDLVRWKPITTDEYAKAIGELAARQELEVVRTTVQDVPGHRFRVLTWAHVDHGEQKDVQDEPWLMLLCTGPTESAEREKTWAFIRTDVQLEG